MTKPLVWVLVAVVVVGAGFFISKNNYPRFTPGDIGTTTDSTGRYMDIEPYVRTNISLISPVKAELGGTFYVTLIEIKAGKGTVSYEDGHKVYVADFTYTADDFGKPSITSFDVRR